MCQRKGTGENGSLRFGSPQQKSANESAEKGLGANGGMVWPVQKRILEASARGKTGKLGEREELR